jgi:dienelactone hydrolase
MTSARTWLGRFATCDRLALPAGRCASTLILALALVCALVWPSTSLAQRSVEIPSLDRQGGHAVALSGQWFEARLPDLGKAPAMVLLHGCGGMWMADRSRLDPRIRELAARLNAMGVHALALDSLTPRGERELCTQKTGTRAVTQRNRRLDALGALDWLSQQAGVDGARLGLLGWSNGGSTVLAATNGKRAEVRRTSRHPSLAVAFYPGCEIDLRSGYEATAPLLMLLGAEDDWTAPAPCQQLAASATGAPVEIELYAGAHHGFDGTAPLRLRKDVPNGVNPGQGVHAGGHAPSREASRLRLTAYLQTHWKLHER